MNTIRCRSCGKSIFFAKTAKGKDVPLEADSEKRFVVETGPDGMRTARVVDTYQTHFATCQEADQWRKM